MNYENDVLIIMPCSTKGGAEKQFNLIIKAMNDKNINNAVLYAEKTSSCIKNYICLIRELLMIIRNRKPRVAIVYDIYGKYLIPLLKYLKIRTIYSERNNGKHKLNIGKLCIAMADVQVANSRTAISNMKKYVQGNVEYIPNAVCIPKEYKLNNNTVFKILVPARIHPTKYQHLIVDVANECPQLEFFLYGMIDDSKYYEFLKTRIESTGAENIHYMGFEDQLEKRFQEYDLILLVSDNEGSSNSILEAFANKVICISSDIGSNEEIIRDKRFLFENNVESIMSTIHYVLDIDPIEKTTILEENRKYVEEHYSEEKMCSRYLELINFNSEEK